MKKKMYLSFTVHSQPYQLSAGTLQRKVTLEIGLKI